MKRLTLVALVALLAVPAAAQESTAPAPEPQIATTIMPEIDRVLWCGSAFYWLAGSAEDSGDEEEAEMYDRWSKRLLDIAGVALAAEGLLPATIETMIANYDEKALVDLASDAPPHDVATCPTLLGEFR